MTRERMAQAITAVCIAGVLGALVLRRTGGETAPPAPEDIVYSMLDSARDGNVNAYLDSYSGALRNSLRQAAAEQGDARFAQYLKDTNAAIKGIAVTAPQAVSDTEVKVRVEYVYEDRNEVQQMILEKHGKDWKIARLDSAERVKTVVPYGAPVQ